MAASIQRSFLPPELPKDERGRFEVCAFTQSAQDVGGDLYDVSELPGGRVGICLGDVSGKGIPAALYMARVVSEFRMLCAGGSPANDVLSALNLGLVQGAMRGMFVTFAYGILDPASGEFHLANAGHLPLLLAKGNGELHWVGSASGPPLGMLPSSKYQDEVLTLAPNDSLLFYSDGIVEARNKEGELFDEERLQRASGSGGGGASRLMSAVLESIRDFTKEAPQADDMTLVSLSWAG
ncbi:MAG: PP2C family protein-serine/threonine phosphatase [Nitrospinota bacterium]